MNSKVINPGLGNLFWLVGQSITAPLVTFTQLTTRSNWKTVGGKTIMVALPSCEEQAKLTRTAWMRLAGLPAGEIAEYCNLELYPADLAEEIENLRAIRE